ncbi:serine/threonine-protein kinase [Actinomadura kijaniata]|uniref:serine/threonine-protein kinase n=1 Tax=Actinomadura kijaniata TaxID=46161 RepID=UPI0008300F56|nr:serine/threonine-protein kinase [Actinomadura kijaniata]
MSAGVEETQGQSRLLAGRYRLTSVVGRGGMGTVWRAWDEALHREVAVKEVALHPSLSEEERAQRHERTLREARASARLNHPGVVTVHDVVDEDGRPWIVMELVQARSLQEVVDADGPLPPGRVAAIGRQVAGALRAAHAIGILHRDVKPANVLITPDGRAVLTDFGIAQIAGDATLTQAGMIMGSPAYMSPERLNGERARPASDLWALGATLYAACEGRAPHHRDDAMAMLAAVMTQDPPPPRNAGPLAPVLAALLERDPARRMGVDAAEATLSRIVADEAARTAPDIGPAAPPAAQGATASGASTAPGGATLVRTGPAATPSVPVPPAPVPWPQETGPVRRRRFRQPGWVTLLEAVLTVAVIVAVVVATFTSDGGDRTGDKTGDRAGDRTGGSVASAETGKKKAVVPEKTATKPTLPPGMRWAGMQDGYRIPVPAGWTMRRDSGDRVYWLDPRSDAYIMVDRTAWTGDPIQHWVDWEKEVLAKGQPRGYRRITLRPTEVQGKKAADLEFVWSDGLRAKDRGVVIEGQSYAVMVAVPASQWNQRLESVNNVLDGFHV